MVIALDGTPLTEPTGGVARYTWELARALAETFPEDHYWLVSDQAIPVPVDRPPNLHVGARPSSPLERRWWLWGLSRELERRGAEVFHGTDFSVPYIARGRPSVMTVHDATPWRAAVWNHASARVRLRTPGLLQFGLVRKVITPSEAVRQEVLAQFALPEASVVAIPLAARELFRPVPQPVEVPYFLFVGTLEARKNLGRLIEAWRSVRAKGNVDLVLAGRLRDGFPAPAAEPGLRYLGRVEDAELPRLYSNALALVYPSLYEGFGLPLLEAMQCGCPVIASQDPALMETTAGAALHVEATDTAALAAAMEAVWLSPSRARQLRQAGMLRAAQFSWRETAHRTREVYAAARGH